MEENLVLKNEWELEEIFSAPVPKQEMKEIEVGSSETGDEDFHLAAGNICESSGFTEKRQFNSRFFSEEKVLFSALGTDRRPVYITRLNLIMAQ